MEKDNTQYFNDEWNRPSKPGSETYSLEILDFNEKGIKRYTLE
jgi:hypothetical protein